MLRRGLSGPRRSFVCRPTVRAAPRAPQGMRMSAEELLKQSRPREALADLQAMIRATPEDAKLRVFLFQLLCVLGDWDRAMAQLQIAAQMDAKNLLMAQ